MFKAVIVFDLGPGDGGKGGIVHKLSCHHNAHTIIKVGGAQGNHGVNNGEKQFAFSQWGCGTLEGVRTHISSLFVASPEGLINEANELKKVGVLNPYSLLTIDERVVCATPYHGIASRLRELARGNNPRGTIGSGVGEAYRESMRGLSIKISDLTSHDLGTKLAKIRERYCDELHDTIHHCEFLPEDKQEMQTEINLLYDDRFLTYNINRFAALANNLHIVGPDYLNHNVFHRGSFVVESSHGVLTDNHYGLCPHVSAIRTLPAFTFNMLRDSGYDDKIETIGVHRAYSIRHGAGPMPTADPAMNELLLPGSHKLENRYQGKVRVGPLDLVLLRYALDMARPFCDSLAITWFDQIVTNGSWRICDEYEDTSIGFFHSSKCIRPFEGRGLSSGVDRLNRQRDLSRALLAVKPIISSIAVPDSIEEQFRLCDRTLHEKLGVPVHIVSFGSTPRDKVIKELA